jgi:hypothetical protein
MEGSLFYSLVFFLELYMLSFIIFFGQKEVPIRHFGIHVPYGQIHIFL